MSHTRMFTTQDKRDLLIKQAARLNVKVSPSAPSSSEPEEPTLQVKPSRK